jgi:NACHT domain
MRRASPKFRLGLFGLALLVTTVLLVGLPQYIHPGLVTTVASALGPSMPSFLLELCLAITRPETVEGPAPPEVAEKPVAQRLVEMVRKEWNDEVKLRRLHDPHPLTVSWQAVDAGLVDNWDNVVLMARKASNYPGSDPASWAADPTVLAGAADPTVLAGSGNRGGLVWVLSRVPTGRLVVLGGRGAGKTILLVQLGLDLLKQWTLGKPVPVLVSLASWNPAKQGLHTWLVDQLTTNYDLLAESSATGKTNLAWELLDAHLLLPILDGLDELDKSVRGQAIVGINDALLNPDDGLIVSCRTEDYREAVNPDKATPVPLWGTAGVEVLDLNPDDVSTYLREGAGSTADRWDLVLATLDDENTPTGRVLRTPLMVSLARIIYNPRSGEQTGGLPDPEVLCNFSTDVELKRHLFDAFILAAYRDYSDSDKRRGWSVDEVKPWLKYLAIHLENLLTETHLKENPNGDVSFAWWQLRYIAPRPLSKLAAQLPRQLRGLAERIARMPRRLSGLAVGLVAGLATGLTAGFGAHIGAGIGIGLGFGLLLGLAARWLVRRRITRSAKPTTGLNTEYIQGLVGGLVGGLLGGFVAGLVSVIVIGRGRGLAGELPIGLGVGMGIGPTCGFWDGLFGGLVGGVSGGLVGTLGVGVGLAAGLLNGLGVGVTAGFSVEFFGLRKPARLARYDKKGRPGGIAVGGTVGGIYWVIVGPVIGILAGLSAGILAGYAVGLVDVPADDLEAVGPGAVLKRDRFTFIKFGIVVALVTGLIGGLTAGLVAVKEKKVEASPAFLLANGWGIALATAIVLGLSFAFAKSSWGSFTLARCWLALRGDLPWCLMKFLTDAHERGVLRQVGAVYQFRHLDLQQHLAGLPPPTVPAKSGEAEQDERMVEAVAGPAQALVDVGVDDSEDHGGGEVA